MATTPPKRTLIIGDIHGCFNELQLLLEKVHFNPSSDQLISVGDVINKGPDSLNCLKLLTQNNAHIVMGNHEWALLKDIDLGPSNRFKNLFDSLKNDSVDWISYLKKFPGYIEEDDFIVVHAGMHPTMPLKETPIEILCHIRTWDGKGDNFQLESNPPWYEFYQNEKLVIFGHWAKRGLIQRSNAIGLDTGCVYGNYLSALILPDRKIVQVKANKAYSQITKYE